MTANPLARRDARRALSRLLGEQTPNRAWRRRAGDASDDIGTTAWAIEALLRGGSYGLGDPVLTLKALTDAGAWIDAVTDPATGAAGWSWAPPPGWHSTADRQRILASTAIALGAHLMLGRHPRDPRIDRTADLLGEWPPTWQADRGADAIDLAYWRAGTAAMVVLEGRLAPRTSGNWYRGMYAALLGRQGKRDAARGRWSPAAGRPDGPVYATALAVLTLQSTHDWSPVRIAPPTAR